MGPNPHDHQGLKFSISGPPHLSKGLLQGGIETGYLKTTFGHQLNWRRQKTNPPRTPAPYVIYKDGVPTHASACKPNAFWLEVLFSRKRRKTNAGTKITYVIVCPPSSLF